MRGALTVTMWDAGSVAAGGAMIPTVVVFPEMGGPYPVVGVFHGLNGEGADHPELAATLASYGAVVVLPDMPCRLSGGCDHAANAGMISALLEWAVAQSGDASSQIAGKVDGARRGLVGHSFGALNSHIAASMDATIDSVVLLDPNDDGGEGLAATPGVMAPTAQLIAANEGSCNSAWSEDMVRPMLPAPTLQLTVAGSGHCDPADASDAICEFACGSGDRATNPTFRRYAVAWTHCVLSADTTMAPWLGGPMMGDDETAGRIIGVTREGFDMLPCRGGVIPMPDAGPPPADVDSGPFMPNPDTGPRPDAGPTGGSGGDDEGGCGCHVPTRRSRATLALVFAAALASALLRRRTRR
jgi:dienelactone hydrolase